jgi:hypothetical protein
MSYDVPDKDPASVAADGSIISSPWPGAIKKKAFKGENRGREYWAVMDNVFDEQGRQKFKPGFFVWADGKDSLKPYTPKLLKDSSNSAAPPSTSATTFKPIIDFAPVTNKIDTVAAEQHVTLTNIADTYAAMYKELVKFSETVQKQAASQQGVDSAIRDLIGSVMVRMGTIESKLNALAVGENGDDDEDEEESGETKPVARPKKRQRSGKDKKNGA